MRAANTLGYFIHRVPLSNGHSFFISRMAWMFCFHFLWQIYWRHKYSYCFVLIYNPNSIVIHNWAYFDYINQFFIFLKIFFGPNCPLVCAKLSFCAHLSFCAQLPSAPNCSRPNVRRQNVLEPLEGAFRGNIMILPRTILGWDCYGLRQCIADLIPLILHFSTKFTINLSLFPPLIFHN